MARKINRINPKALSGVKREESIKSLKELNNKWNKSDSLERLYNYSVLWDKLREKRKDNTRCFNFLLGNQWCDTMIDPDTGRAMTEEEYLRGRGKFPRVQNIIRPLVKRIIGEYSSNDAEIVVMSRRKNEQQLEDLLSNAIQSVHHINNTKLMDAKLLETFLTTGMALLRVQYEYIDEIDESDVKYTTMDVNRFFFNSDVIDFRLDDIKIVGYIHDYTIDDVINIFAKSIDDENFIRNIYRFKDRDTSLKYIYSMYNNIMKDNRLIDDFFYAPEYYCRVIEVWEKRAKWVYHIIDEADAIAETADDVDIDMIAKINRERIKQGQENNIPKEDIPLIVVNKIRKYYWHGTFYTPYGDVLWDADSPYMHGEHPFVFYAYPMINGTIHSYVKDLIPLNKAINRNVVLLDSIIAASSKGAVFVPIQIVPETETPEDFANQYSDTNRIMFFKYQPGIPLPQAVANNNTNIGAYEAIARDLNMIQQISGVYGAMQGQAPSANTPAALYAQQAANSSLNVVDYLNAFESFLELRDRKTLKLILQFYTNNKFMYIRGKDDSENMQMVKFDKENIKKSDYVLIRRKSQLAAAYKLLFEDRLFQLSQTGMIPPEIYLRLSNLPYAKRILDELESMKQQTMQQMAQMQQMQQPPQNIPPQR